MFQKGYKKSYTEDEKLIGATATKSSNPDDLTPLICTPRG